MKDNMRLHTGEKPNKCTVCEQVFSQLSSRNLQMKTHTGMRRFECTECNKTYKFVSSLKAHMKSVNCTEQLMDSQ